MEVMTRSDATVPADNFRIRLPYRFYYGQAMAGGAWTFPLMGIGTYKLKDPQIIRGVIDAALESGYKLIDTAAVYRNEHTIGQALKDLCPKHGLNPQDDILITSKLAPSDHGYENALLACARSLEALQRPYLDAYLIHWPGVQGRRREDQSNADLRRESWRALVELHRQGKVKAIGVSNYTIRHLRELLSYATVRPYLLQSECHPLLVQQELREFCASHGIFFQAYSSLGTGELLLNSQVTALASQYGKSASVVLLRWAVQQGIGVIPKASTAAHVRENWTVTDFELSKPDIEVLNSLDQSYHFCWDPSGVA